MTEPVVYVVDDDAPVRESLTLLIRSMRWSVQCFDSADAFLADFIAGSPGCLVLDIRMPGMSGLDLQRELERRDIDIPIIFLTGHGDIPMAVEALKHGAIDFIEKPFRDQALLDSINTALQSDREHRAERAAASDAEQRLATLTPREHEVLNAIVDGHANKVVAADLGVSERTVEIHRAKVMAKMGVRSLAQLVRMVVRLE